MTRARIRGTFRAPASRTFAAPRRNDFQVTHG